MSKYTTGEISKLCNVSVRTVQYYDSRGILVPSKLTEGGRRLYSDEDLRQMKIICFLRELGLPINSIGELLSEEHPENVISLLLDEQEKTLRGEINERRSKLDKLEELKQSLKWLEHFSVESIGDVAHIMENKKKLRRVHLIMLAVGILMDIAEISTLILWIVKGIWLPFAICMCGVVATGIWISSYYFKRVAYICPKCHTVFKPTFKQSFWSRHTPSTRKLTCPACDHHGFCVETYGKEPEKNG